MGVDETLLEEVVRRVLTVSRTDKIILFGSAVSGQMNRDRPTSMAASSMKPPEVALRELVLQWLVAFHCQQAAEKYLKAFLLRHHIEVQLPVEL